MGFKKFIIQFLIFSARICYNVRVIQIRVRHCNFRKPCQKAGVADQPL